MAEQFENILTENESLNNLITVDTCIFVIGGNQDHLTMGKKLGEMTMFTFSTSAGMGKNGGLTKISMTKTSPPHCITES